MSPLPSRLGLLAFLLVGEAAGGGPAARAAEPNRADAAPAKNWVLPLFTKEGFHSTTLSGDQVEYLGVNQIDVVNIKIFRFSGDAAANLTTILLSPQASYFPRENRASGPANLRLIAYRDNAEITGEDWTYEQAGEKISIHRHVRVVFHTAKLSSVIK